MLGAAAWPVSMFGIVLTVYLFVCMYTGLQGSWAGRHQCQDDEPRSFQEQHIPYSVR